jgi:DNA-binding winged helix-turn-helix (wHTH) protein
MVAPDQKVIEFDRFALDRGRCSVFVDGCEVTLRPKTFDVLAYLTSHHGRVVTKQELLDAVWPDLTVSEDSLVQCISELRRTLGDGDRSLIKTVSRRGYILEALPASVIGASSLGAAARAPGAIKDSLARLMARAGRLTVIPISRLFFWLACAAVVLLFCGSALSLWRMSLVEEAATDLFTAQDAQQLVAIANAKQLPLPPFTMRAPPPEASNDVRRFLGIWVSSTGWVNSNRQLMLIVERVDRLGTVAGYVIDGPPQPQSIAQEPARARPFIATFSGGILTFEARRGKTYIALTPNNTIDYRVAYPNGRIGVVLLDPVWTLVGAERSRQLQASR